MLSKHTVKIHIEIVENILTIPVAFIYFSDYKKRFYKKCNARIVYFCCTNKFHIKYVNGIVMEKM